MCVSKNYYLKLHIQSTNIKCFSRVAFDNIIRAFVFCPKILLHAAIYKKILLCTLCRKTWYSRPRMDTEHYSLWGPPTRSLPLDLAGGLPSQDPLPRPLNVRHKSPPLWQILSDFNNSFTVATQCTLKSTTTPQIC